MRAVFLVADHDLVDNKPARRFQRFGIFFIAVNRICKAGSLPRRCGKVAVFVIGVGLIRRNARIFHMVNYPAVGTRKHHGSAL